MMKITGRESLAILLLAFSLHLGGAAPCRATDEDLAQIKKELAEIRQDLKEIKKLLTPPHLRRASVVQSNIGTVPVLGRPDAPLTLLDFSDFHCPFCRRFQEDTFPKIREAYIDTGKVRYAFRDFPLTRIHPGSMKAAESARCAGEQGRYWEMHRLIFRDRGRMGKENLNGYAKTLDLDLASFKDCVSREKFREEIQRDIRAGEKAGVRGTPSFVIGTTGRDGSVTGKLIVGAQSYKSFQREIEGLLKAKGGKE